MNKYYINDENNVNGGVYVAGVNNDEDEEQEDIQLPSKIPDKDNKNEVIRGIVQKVGKILEDHIISLTKIIYNSESIISFKKRQMVIEKYKEFTEQKGRYFTFMAPQPVTLTNEYLKINNPRSILKDRVFAGTIILSVTNKSRPLSPSW